jgi:hypothetical protein
MIRPTAAATIALLALFDSPGAAVEDGCTGEGANSVIVECESDRPPTANADNPGRTHSELRREYEWVPSCSGAAPGNEGVAELDCPSARVCPDAQLMLMRLFSRTVNPGEPAAAWTDIRSECRYPAAPRDQPRTLTTADVLSAIRSIGLPTNQIHGPAYTLVNLDTTFSTTPHPLHRTLTILGYTVTINAQPTTYTWNWDDGTTTHTSTPGRPYPHTDITHTYTHPTDHQPPLTPSIDTTYHARYRVDHGPWTTIPDPITTHGPTHQLPVKQATAVLVQPD